MKTKEYIENEEQNLEQLKQRFDKINSKWIAFGLGKEQVFLENYIKLKEDLIHNLRKLTGAEK